MYACTESKKCPARERGVVVPEVRPGHLGQDPGLLGPVADRLERGERLPVEVEGRRQVTATGCELRRGRRATRRLLPRRRAAAGSRAPRSTSRWAVVEVARDGVQDAGEARGEALGPGEAERSAPLDRSPRPPRARPRDRGRAAREPAQNAAMQSSRSAPISSAMRYASAHSSFDRSIWPSIHDASPAVISAPARPTVGAPRGVGVRGRRRRTPAR